jgi:hypothetical protein
MGTTRNANTTRYHTWKSITAHAFQIGLIGLVWLVCCVPVYSQDDNANKNVLFIAVDEFGLIPFHLPKQSTPGIFRLQFGIKREQGAIR